VTLLIAALAVLSFPSVVGASPAPDRRAADDVLVHWRDDAHSVVELPSELGAGPRAALETWAPWAADRGYRIELSDDGRVLLLVRSRKRPRAELELVEDATKLFDSILPAPPRREDGSPAPQPEDGSDPLALRTGPGEAWTWIRNGSPPDTDTIVLVQARNQEDYETVVDLVVAAQPYLASWAASGKRASGFVLERPLCGVWLDGAADLEEYDAKNELVHRLARLLTLRRFGRQPWWLTLGLAWHFELELRGGVYCFPYRSGFVGRNEHTGWPSQLKRVAKDPGIDITALARWKRGEWDDERAILAWGFTLDLIRRHERALPMILEDFRVLQNLRGIERRTDGSWSVVVGYEPSAEDQEETMRWFLGDDFETDTSKALAKGKRYRPGRGR